MKYIYKCGNMRDRKEGKEDGVSSIKEKSLKKKHYNWSSGGSDYSSDNT